MKNYLRYFIPLSPLFGIMSLIFGVYFHLQAHLSLE